MAVEKLTDIGKNAVEDGVEDFVSSFLYRRMRKLTEPFLKDFDSNSEFDEAMQSFIQTLSMGLTLYAYSKIMNFFFERGVKISTALWVYIVAGSYKTKLIQKLKNSKFKGKKLLRAVSTIIGADKTAERIEVAKMIQNNVNSFDAHKFHYQNQSFKMDSKLDNLSLTASTLKNSNENSYLTRFTHKTMTGTWLNNTDDRRLYERATGIKLVEAGQGSWTNIYENLNKYNEFAKTVDGEIINLATAIKAVLARSGMAS